MILRSLLIAMFVLSPVVSRAESLLEMNAIINTVMKIDPDHGGEIVQWALTCKSPCELAAKHAGGGNESQYRAAAMILARDEKNLEVKASAVCRSACTILVDLVAANGRKTCVAWETAWGVHSSRIREADGSFSVGLPHVYRAPRIQEWIDRKKGMKPDFRYHYIPSELVEEVYGLCPGTTL